MNQTQMGILQLMQAVAMQQTQQKPQKSESSEKNEFRDLMKQQSEASEKAPEKDEAVKQPEAGSEKQELDAVALQQLAAMQMFCADTTQIVVPEENAPVVQNVAAPLTQQAGDAQAGTQAAAQPMVQDAAAQQKNPETAVQTNVEQVEQAEASPVEQTVVKTPESTDTHGGELRQEAETKQTPETVKREKPAEKDVEIQVETAPEKVFSKVETAPVKVSESGTEVPKTKDVADQVTEKLTQALSKGETRVEIQLNPEHLGKITVELTQKGDGTMQIVLHAQNSQTRTMLERELPAMQSLLSRDTQQNVQVQVPRQEDAQQNHFQEDQQHHHQQQEQKQQRQHNEDFLDQLRLGLVHTSEGVS